VGDPFLGVRAHPMLSGRVLGNLPSQRFKRFTHLPGHGTSYHACANSVRDGRRILRPRSRKKSPGPLGAQVPHHGDALAAGAARMVVQRPGSVLQARRRTRSSSARGTHLHSMRPRRSARKRGGLRSSALPRAESVLALHTPATFARATWAHPDDCAPHRKAPAATISCSCGARRPHAVLRPV